MNPEVFEFLSDLVKTESGLVLTPDKSYLLESRLMPIVRARGMKEMEDLVAAAKSKTDKALINEITEAMTTNESFFFRDTRPFDTFRDASLPFLLDARKQTKLIRIWCAAASSGQEPYSLAMILKEMQAKMAGWRVEIIGTDLSTEILDKAKNGVYTQFEVQRGLPVQLLVKYFEKKEEHWQIKSEIRDMVKYKPLNLLDPFTGMGKFDIVFCRNVLIYFDQPTKTKVLEKIHGLMPNDGVLYLGGAESVLGISDKFRPVPNFRGVYEMASENGGVTYAPPAAGAPAAGVKATA